MVKYMTTLSFRIHVLVLFQTLRRTVENIKDPLYRYFEREVNSGAKLLQDVIHDLEDVVLICQVSKHICVLVPSLPAPVLLALLPAQPPFH
jgi:dynein heavy chain 1